MPTFERSSLALILHAILYATIDAFRCVPCLDQRFSHVSIIIVLLATALIHLLPERLSSTDAVGVPPRFVVPEWQFATSCLRTFYVMLFATQEVAIRIGVERGCAAASHMQAFEAIVKLKKAVTSKRYQLNLILSVAPEILCLEFLDQLHVVAGLE